MADDERTPHREQPPASRLKLPRGYTVAADDTLLPWSHVIERLEQAQTYWLATTRPDGHPHVAPIWGVWVAWTFYFDGIPTASWARNLASNPAVALHLESGTDVVILEGVGEDVPTIKDAALATQIIQAWDAKYGRLLPDPAGSGMFRLRPRTVRAWSRFPDDATRWQFPAI